PRKVVHVPAEYPVLARDAKVEGLVIIEAKIDERGRVTNATVLRGVPLLDEALRDERANDAQAAGDEVLHAASSGCGTRSSSSLASLPRPISSARCVMRAVGRPGCISRTLCRSVSACDFG
ncbi:MAG: hypothetical protein EHM89_17210, partial [Acidobacteria bacterium]